MKPLSLAQLTWGGDFHACTPFSSSLTLPPVPPSLRPASFLPSPPSFQKNLRHTAENPNCITSITFLIFEGVTTEFSCLLSKSLYNII
uniref:Uncharacterized protein n=1 Tax=Kryptolebias marmoratus TaxID=37003 RepID=A0A3Q3BPZ1_KRYMA